MTLDRYAYYIGQDADDAATARLNALDEATKLFRQWRVRSSPIVVDVENRWPLTFKTLFEVLL